VIKCIDDDHYHNYSTSPDYNTRCSWGVVAMILVNFLWSYFDCSYYVPTGGRPSRPKAWEWICRRQLLLDKLSTRIYKLFVSTPRIALIGVKIIESSLCVNK
jgi:hypothetical protein